MFFDFLCCCPLSGTCSLTVTVIDVNEKPIVASHQTLQVHETAAVGTNVDWALNATDPDNAGRFNSVVPPRQLLSWSIAKDDSTNPLKFVLTNQYSGLLAVNGVLNANMPGGQTMYTLQVSVSDGMLTSASVAVVISVVEVNEPPTLQVPTLGNEATLVENSVGNANVATLVGTDPDTGDTLSFSILNCEHALNVDHVCVFKIDGTALKVNDAATSWNFNFENRKKYVIEVKVTDSGGLSSSGVLTVLITNTNDAPTLTTADAVTSVGIQPDVNTVVVTLTALDEDLSNVGSTEVLTLTIASGNVDSAWEITSPVVGGNLIGAQQSYWKIVVKDPMSNHMKTAGNINVCTSPYSLLFLFSYFRCALSLLSLSFSLSLFLFISLSLSLPLRFYMEFGFYSD